MNIHKTAVIDNNVIIEENVEIGAYSVIKGKVKIGKNTIIKDNVTIYGPITIGEENIFHPGAVIGNVSQDLKYKGEETEVIIGNKNSIREFVTIHQGTADGGYKTVIGDNNLLMSYVHIAHDCQIANNVIIANSTQLAGHVILNDFAYIGGMVGVHQFVTFGSHCFVGFMSRINRDVPPFITVEGNPASERFINSTGLSRRGFSQDDILLIKKAFNILYVDKSTKQEKYEKLLATDFQNNLYIQKLLNFLDAVEKGKNGRALEGLR